MALLSSACRSVVEKGLTPPTLSETPGYNNHHSVAGGYTVLVRTGRNCLGGVPPSSVQDLQQTLSARDTVITVSSQFALLAFSELLQHFFGVLHLAPNCC